VLDMHGSREAYVPLKPFNPFAHKYSLPIFLTLNIPLPLLLPPIRISIHRPQAPTLHHHFPPLNHRLHYIPLSVTLFDHISELLKELEDDPGHVPPEYDAHLSELLLAVPVVGAQPVEVLA
jgi:hypothetical protein